MIREVELHLFDDCDIWVKRIYNNSEDEVGLKSSFEITSIESVQKDLIPLLDWSLSQTQDYLLEIEELCIKYIEEGDYESLN